MSNKRVLKFDLSVTHLDYAIAREQARQARALRNTLTCLARSALAYQRDPAADLHVACEYGSDVIEWVHSNPRVSTKYAFDQLTRLVRERLGITLNSKAQQRVGIMLASSFKSYFALCKSGAMARLPGYARDYAVVEYTSQAISSRALRENIVLPTGWSTGFKLPWHVSPSSIKSARLKHKNKRFTLEVVYEATPSKPTRSRGITAGLDLGVNNLAVVAYSNGQQGFLINGRPLKSMNAYANKLLAKERSRLDKQKLTKEEIRNNNALNRIRAKRERKIDHYLHSASKQLVEELVTAGVRELVIGWNQRIKQNANMGRKGNQRFLYIPFARFISMIKYKAEEQGISVIVREESYTSKASFLDHDPIPTHPCNTKPCFQGRRHSRGLYITHTGQTINADTNAAYNIITKNGTSINRGKGCVVHPVVLKITGHTQHKIIDLV